jgi:hypothetical protein
MQFNVISCANDMIPLITTPNDIRSKNVYPGDVVKFDFSTSGSTKYDSIYISWNNTIPGAIWTSTNGKVIHATAALTWTPTSSQISSLPYTFTVTARDNICPLNAQFTRAYQIRVNPKPTSIITEKSISQSDFNIYPNPASETLNIIYQGKNLKQELYLMNSFGQMIKSMTLKPGEKEEIDISNLPNGLYLIRDMEGGSIHKIIVSH